MSAPTSYKRNRPFPGDQRPIRVLHIASGDLWAGAEVQIHSLLSELAAEPRIEVQAALMNAGELAGRLRGLGIPVEVIDESRLAALAITQRLRYLMLRFRPDIIHTHRTKENLLGLVANTISLRVPMVRTLHGAFEHPTSWRRPHRHLVHCADFLSGRYLTRAVVAVSSAMGRSLELDCGYRNVTVIPNGIDVDRIIAIQVPAPFASSDSSVKHVGFIGRLEPVKRCDLFLQVAKELCQTELKYAVQFHVFGDGSERAALTEMSDRLGLSEHVVFHGHHPETVRWMRSLHAIVLCSDHEGLPMTLLESIAAGTPVVGHATGGLLEVMNGNIGGILVHQHAAGAYAEALISLLDGLPTFSTEARNRVREHWSAERNARAAIALYDRCLS